MVHESSVEGDFLQAVVHSLSEETDENADLDRRVEEGLEECTRRRTILVDSVLWSVSLKEDLLYTPEQNTAIKDR